MLIIGIKLKHLECKLCLFKNYLILYIANPSVFLPVLHDTIETFSQTISLQINQSKSILFPINSPEKTSVKIQENYSFQWMDKTIPYLGIKIPLKSSGFIKYNLLRSIKKLMTSM